MSFLQLTVHSRCLILRVSQMVPRADACCDLAVRPSVKGLFLPVHRIREPAFISRHSCPTRLSRAGIHFASFVFFWSIATLASPLSSRVERRPGPCRHVALPACRLREDADFFSGGWLAFRTEAFPRPFGLAGRVFASQPDYL